MEEGKTVAWCEVVGCQRILGQCILQSLQLLLRHVAFDSTVAEVGNDFRLEALVNGAIVVAHLYMKLILVPPSPASPIKRPSFGWHFTEFVATGK